MSATKTQRKPDEIDRDQSQDEKGVERLSIRTASFTIEITVCETEDAISVRVCVKNADPGDQRPFLHDGGRIRILKDALERLHERIASDCEDELVECTECH